LKSLIETEVLVEETSGKHVLRVFGTMPDHLFFSCAAVWGAAEGEDEGHENHDRCIDVICDTHPKDAGTGHEGAQGSEVRPKWSHLCIFHSKERQWTSGKWKCILKTIVKQRGGGIRGAVWNLHMWASMSAFVSVLALLTFMNLLLFKHLVAVFQISAANSLCTFSMKEHCLVR
jgi:hypothetical protein